MATLTASIFPSLLARNRGKFLEDLWNGDPTAWTILVVVIVAMVAWNFIKKKSGGGGGQ